MVVIVPHDNLINFLGKPCCGPGYFWHVEDNLSTVAEYLARSVLRTKGSHGSLQRLDAFCERFTTGKWVDDFCDGYNHGSEESLGENGWAWAFKGIVFAQDFPMFEKWARTVGDDLSLDFFDWVRLRVKVDEEDQESDAFLRTSWEKLKPG